MTINIATIFDKNYLVRALALYQSAREFMPDIKFWFLCLDTDSIKYLKELNLENTEILSLNDLKDPKLISTKNTRTYSEFAFTAKSAFCSYILNSKLVSDGDVVIWSDADILFYSSIEKTVNDLISNNVSIAISPHNFPSENKHLNKKVGKYNAGFIIFVANDISRKCASEWRGLCIEKCTLDTQKGYVGDQMYLNDWSKKYSGIRDIENKGINLGPWNISNYNISEDELGQVTVDNYQLICYHFHGLQMFIEKSGSVSPLPISVRNDKIYKTYTKSIEKSLMRVGKIDKNWQFGFIKKPSILKLAKQKIQRFLREVL